MHKSLVGIVPSGAVACLGNTAMDNEQHDDLARSITGGTFFFVLFITAFLIIYTMAGK